MEPSDADVGEFLAKVTPATRRRDADTLVDLMSRITGQGPVLWGTIVGFGEYHYRYETGREGDSPAVAFAPRKSATTVYLPEGVGAYEDALAELGAHSTGVGCLYLKNLDDVDLAVLEGIIGSSFRTVTQGDFGARARGGDE